jgi:hypothetical protein
MSIRSADNESIFEEKYCRGARKMPASARYSCAEVG